VASCTVLNLRRDFQSRTSTCQRNLVLLLGRAYRPLAESGLPLHAKGEGRLGHCTSLNAAFVFRQMHVRGASFSQRLSLQLHVSEHPTEAFSLNLTNRGFAGAQSDPDMLGLFNAFQKSERVCSMNGHKRLSTLGIGW